LRNAAGAAIVTAHMNANRTFATVYYRYYGG
jgi:hypothetical protein